MVRLTSVVWGVATGEGYDYYIAGSGLGGVPIEVTIS